MNKKGFSLIELLAVIIVLAILAFIVTPIVTKVIDGAKASTAVVGAKGYLKGINNYIGMQELYTTNAKLEKNRIYQVTEDTEYEYSEIEYLTEHPEFNNEPGDLIINNILTLSGKLANDGYIILGNNKIIEAEFIISGYQIYCDESERCVSLGKATSSGNVESIEIDYQTTVLLAGETMQLNAIVNTTDGTEAKVTWSSTDTDIASVNKKGLVTGKKEGTTTIIAKAENKKSRLRISVINNSILGYVSGMEFENDSYVDITVNGENYKIHAYNFEGNQVFSTNQVFGNDNDVASGSNENQMAQNMVVVKVNGDLTINENVEVGPYYTEYGGPKGFLLYVTGKLINNGTIDNSHGAYAEGQNVYLWKNSDDTYEYVPAVGAVGGNYANSNAGKPGEDGTTVSKRATGGGGSGASNGPSYNTNSGAGGTGTSYSGGSGGGGTNACSGSGISRVDPASSKGGNGGPSCGGTAASDGAGNKGSVNGTGGLLIIYADAYENNGLVKATGVSPVETTFSGGSSGGGSINIFTNQSTGIDKFGIIVNDKYSEMLGDATSEAGEAVGTSKKGGAGGAGTVNIGEIRNGQYYDLKEIISQDIESFKTKSTITGESILTIINSNISKSGYYNLQVNGEDYYIHAYVYEGNQVFSTNQVFGDSSDVASGSKEEQMAQNMVVVKVNGDLTINENVEVGPYYTEYGGPKGFLLYVTGELINNGTIDNSHGAYAEGQNVYLWKNSDDTYEYVPAVGAAGGNYANSNAGKPGEDGTTVSKRATGGGGSGASNGPSYNTNSGAGGTGTSYSGGSGGGGTNACSRSGISRVDPASSKGGNGGPSCGGTAASDGAGNKGSVNGTGGLLIIYANTYENNGLVKATGVSPVETNFSGGSSGGGSINIFTNNEILIKGNINIDGGSDVGTSKKGGKGGKGSITYTQITN